MRAHTNSQPHSDPGAPNRSSTWVVIVLLTSVAGCAEAAGLEEHTRYLGFPDSLSVPCSNGLLTVNCDLLSTSAPQDGHTLNAKPVYEVSGADVIDKITGLSWYRTPGGPQNHDQAVEYCDVLPGNYRLPTRIELISLLDFRDGSLVRIDKDMFPDVKPMRYWTSSQYGDIVDDFWIVDFCSACMAEYPVVYDHTSASLGVLCVKSEGEPFQTGPFTVAGVENRFLRDNRTGLMWMKKTLEVQKDWKDSLLMCAKAPDGAYGDFRMPNAKELATIVDESKVSSETEASIQSPFEIGYNQSIWSSTPSRTPGKFFKLNATGASIQAETGALGYIQTLCVRGPD
ncbi:MAG TPA: DUF1566 domain-containing protein [Polyangium sp.]|nr:DUF1566 domain-containing protein [Polyangium sp.]